MSQLAPTPSVRFWPFAAHARVASTRIRCLLVADGLRAQGVDAALYQPGEQPAVLVLSKRYDEASLAHALQLRQQAGTRLLLDLCDNHFYFEDPAPRWLERAERLRRACRAVDGVVTASEPLADAVRQACGDAVPVAVVPDALDLRCADFGGSSAADLPHALRLRLFLATHRAKPGRRLLWFGNHGTAYGGGGMEDLCRIREPLAAHHGQAPLTLVVLSNHWKKFRQLRKGWAWPTLYLPWSGANFTRAMRHSDVALIPVRRNPMTVCKTSNRLTTAVMNGLAVAADALPSYEMFRDETVLDDWEQGLGELMASAQKRAHRVAAARQKAVECFGLDAIARRWREVLTNDLCPPGPAAHGAPASCPPQTKPLATPTDL